MYGKSLDQLHLLCGVGKAASPIKRYVDFCREGFQPTCLFSTGFIIQVQIADSGQFCSINCLYFPVRCCCHSSSSVEIRWLLFLLTFLAREYSFRVRSASWRIAFTISCASHVFVDQNNKDMFLMRFVGGNMEYIKRHQAQEFKFAHTRSEMVITKVRKKPTVPHRIDGPQ